MNFVTLRRDPVAGDLLGTPGLWKNLKTARVFDLPLAGRLRPLEEWAEATAHGEVPHGWEPPPRAEAEDWAGSLTVGAAQGELVCDERRLALVFPHLGEVARDDWVRRLLEDAQCRWRMVRAGIRDGVARAEIDLTGAPDPEPLVRLAADALPCVVAWLQPSLELLNDPGLKSRLLERKLEHA